MASRTAPVRRRAEGRADQAVHAVALALAAVGVAVLLALAEGRNEPVPLLPLLVYSLGLLAMLGCSAIYNGLAPGPWKDRFQRLDHAAIFLMIGGTYTPFATVKLEGPWSVGLLLPVWAIALFGAATKLLRPRLLARVDIALYLGLGWLGIVAIGSLWAALSPSALALLVAGGAFYSIGVAFCLWHGLRYHNAVWHGFVTAAAGCHYAAIMTDIVMPR